MAEYKSLRIIQPTKNYWLHTQLDMLITKGDIYSDTSYITQLNTGYSVGLNCLIYQNNSTRKLRFSYAEFMHYTDALIIE